MKKNIVIMAFIASFAAGPTDAYAYLDPGTGSMLLQLIIAGVLGLTFTVKLYWRRMTGFFQAKKTPTSAVEQTIGSSEGETDK